MTRWGGDHGYDTRPRLGNYHLSVAAAGAPPAAGAPAGRCWRGVRERALTKARNDPGSVRR